MLSIGNVTQGGACHYWEAIISAVSSLSGVIVGAAGQWWLSKYANRKTDRKEKRQIEMLKQMLDSKKYATKWRNLSTLSHVIGESEEQTRLLLILAGARASEDGKNLWGLLEHHSLEVVEDQET